MKNATKAKVVKAAARLIVFTIALLVVLFAWAIVAGIV